MRRTLDDFQRGTLDDLRRQQCRIRDGHNLIVVAVQDQRRHVELLQVLAEVSLREDLDAVVRALQAGLHAERPEGIADTLRHR